MIEDGGRIDPARTELSRQRSLDKANHRRVVMTDIVTKLQEAACLPNTGCMSIRTCVCDVMEEAADEIERLRGCIMELSVAKEKLEDERDDLLKEVGRATVLLNNVTAEMANARGEIKEMNGRIDNLRLRGRGHV